MIVRIQRPSNGWNTQAFVYNRQRSYVSFLPCTDEIRELLGDRDVIYVEAVLWRGREIEIGSVVPDPGW